MLYHHLKKLAKTGWVTSTTEPQGNRPPRLVYKITPDGRNELTRWLQEPVARTREIRLEFLVKLYFARRLDPDLATRLVAEQRETLHKLAESLASQLTTAPEVDGDTFPRLVLGLRLEQTQAALTWLDRVEEEN
jgi:PadR family transcriptional regulator AphA